jgi:hypothetical protein
MWQEEIFSETAIVEFVAMSVELFVVVDYISEEFVFDWRVLMEPFIVSLVDCII